MKMYKFLTLLLFAGLMTTACSSDDDTGNDDGPTADSRRELYASNNSNGNVTKYDVSEPSTATSKTFLTLSLDSEGIHYDGSTDAVTQASRSFLQLNSYANISVAEDGITINANISSSADLESPRDVAVNGNFYVVSDNADVDGDPNTADGRFFVYVKDSNGFTLRNTVTVDFAVWGIEFVGNDLFAVVDKTSDIAVFTNFTATNTTDATVAANKRITIEGITRTHGLAFDGSTMILTDIGDAALDADGGFHVISDFQTKFNAVTNGETMAVAGNQVRVAGSSTFLGNPVAAEFDQETNTVFIAERANSGGRVLAFQNINAGGNIAPTMNVLLSGASSLSFYKE
ncbi:MAG: hypothetical protein OQJ83_05565 [Altibacter sp.]|nr:hypothetical protein [Altibacter sp.]